MALIGFIGMGNMGYAMLKGALEVFDSSELIFACPDRARCEAINNETGVNYVESNSECANNAKYIVLAVKPQIYDTVLKNIHNIITHEHVVISIAPGITIDYVTGALGGDVIAWVCVDELVLS